MVQLFKDQLLGVGSYGVVCRAKSGSLLCAAKIVNPNLMNPTIMYRIPEEIRGEGTTCNERKWFEQESKFLFELRHPNLVQYLGLCQDPETNLPVLLMELVEDNLTHFLKVPRPTPFYLQVDICHDIAQALLYLHSNHIIHKNLCSNNVLMSKHDTAKLTDFGMALLADLNPKKIYYPFLAIQDKRDYMPPEALKDKPIYTDKTDCFSFGVLVLQILTRKSPKPGSRRKSVKINKSQPGLPRNSCVDVPVSEIERRKDHIDSVDLGHLLLPIALDCLKDVHIERPSAEELCSRMAALKTGSTYGESVRSSQETKESIEQAAHSKDRQIMELLAKVEHLTKEVAQKNHIIATSQEETGKLKKQLQEILSKSSQHRRIESDTEQEWKYSDKKEPALCHVERSMKSTERSSTGQNGTHSQVMEGKN